MVYYLGTDGDAPLVPWNESSPAFHVTPIAPEFLERIRGQLPHRTLLYIGSHEGCGCGFRRDGAGYCMEPDDEPKETTEDHSALATYIDALPLSDRAPQIFACWSGDEAEPIEHRRDFTIADVMDRNFGFREREILTLQSEIKHAPN